MYLAFVLSKTCKCKILMSFQWNKANMLISENELNVLFDNTTKNQDFVSVEFILKLNIIHVERKIMKKK